MEDHESHEARCLNEAKHPRGVFRDEYPPDGQVVHDVYTACGHNAESTREDSRWADPGMSERLWALLDARCPLYACQGCPFQVVSHLRLVD